MGFVTEGLMGNRGAATHRQELRGTDFERHCFTSAILGTVLFAHQGPLTLQYRRKSVCSGL